MGSGFSYVAETEVEHRNVAVYHDDVCKVRECPEVRQVVSGDAAGNAECSDEDAEQTENGDERSGTGNTVPGNFGEGNEAMTKVYAKRQKQMETMTMTKVCRRSGVSAWMESRNFG